MKFFVNVLLDTIWGFIFVCLGAAFILSRIGLDIQQVLSPQDTAWILGATVVMALFLRLPVWLILWLEANKHGHVASGDDCRQTSP